MRPSAKVVGLGPSGSAFVAVYGNAVGIDRARYFKACGEAVPVETPLVEPRYIVDVVKRYKFYSWRREVGEVTYGKARWYILEKAQWVEAMRRGRAGIEEGWDVLVKAGGPYQSVGEKIIVARAYVEGRLEDETAYFVFPEAGIGFYWIFPHGRVLNVGGGFLGISNPVPHVLKFIELWLGNGRVFDVRGAPLTVRPTITLHDGEGFRIGEAAGLVYPLTGEGIRPGILSALALSSALTTKKPLESYHRQLQEIAKQIEFQKKLLGLAQRLASRGNLIELADDSVLRDYIEENLSARTLFTMLAKRPLAGARLVATILKR